MLLIWILALVHYSVCIWDCLLCQHRINEILELSMRKPLNRTEELFCDSSSSCNLWLCSCELFIQSTHVSPTCVCACACVCVCCSGKKSSCWKLMGYLCVLYTVMVLFFWLLQFVLFKLSGSFCWIFVVVIRMLLVGCREVSSRNVVILKIHLAHCCHCSWVDEKMLKSAKLVSCDWMSLGEVIVDLIKVLKFWQILSVLPFK